jgi:acetoin utilization deacetylase AcuC-like enzyme
MIIFHEDYLKHRQCDAFHPESPERLKGIISEVIEQGMKKYIQEPDEFGDDILMLVHKDSYVDAIKNWGEGFYDSDTYVRPETYQIALRSAWGAVTAAELAFKGKPSFALTRPPGHHAGIDFAGGFCYFDNIAIAAEHSVKKHDIERCAIVDIDVHHGNGTENIFRARHDVLYISTHQQGIYPGTGYAEYTGEGEGTGYTVNIPLPSRSGDSTFDAANKKVILPILRKFKPELLLVSFGGDAHYRDPIASLSLSSLGYQKTCDELIAFAEESKTPISFMLEGGYDVPALSECVRATCQRLHGEKVGKLKFTEIEDTMGKGIYNVDRAFGVHKGFWEL